MVRYGIVVLLLAGCGDDVKSAPDAALDAAFDAAPPDAPSIDAPLPADLSCLGAPAPTEANDPVTLGGAAFSIGLGGQMAIAGATMDALLESDPDGLAVATGTTDANGLVSLTVATGGVPLDLFVRTTPADTYLTTELFFPSVVAADLPAPGILLEATTVNLIGSVSGQSQNFGANGFAVVLVFDCGASPVYNAVVTPPTGAVVYAGPDGLPDSSLTATSTSGIAFVFNVEPGDGLLYDAEVEGQSLRDNTARAVAGQIASVGISP